MSKADDIRMRIAELEDDAACLEADIEQGDDNAHSKLDDLLCRIADLRAELEEMEGSDV